MLHPLKARDPFHTSEVVLHTSGTRKERTLSFLNRPYYLKLINNTSCVIVEPYYKKKKKLEAFFEVQLKN